MDEEKKYIDEENRFKEQKRFKSEESFSDRPDSFKFSMDEKLKQFFMDRVNSI